MSARIDYTGQKFTRLTVIEFSHVRRTKAYWLCKCECGNEVTVQGCNLKNKGTKSCGCLNSLGGKTTHGMSKTPIYKTWKNIRLRCYNKKASGYKNYGGRGINVCKRWLTSFENFYEDMGDRPEGVSIDRIDNDGNYEPSNCRWATDEEQRSNKRCSKKNKKELDKR